MRLACVRHAASVDPEPGSNSRSFPGAISLRPMPMHDTSRIRVPSMQPEPAVPSTLQLSSCAGSAARRAILIGRPPGSEPPRSSGAQFLCYLLAEALSSIFRNLRRVLPSMPEALLRKVLQEL